MDERLKKLSRFFYAHKRRNVKKHHSIIIGVQKANSHNKNIHYRKHIDPLKLSQAIMSEDFIGVRYYILSMV